MQIFEPFNLNAKLYEPSVNQELPDHMPSLDFDDPDAMYDVWVKPSLKEDPNAFTKNACVKQLNDIFEIYLDLNKQAPKITRHQLLKELSIQISLYEALIFRDLFLNKQHNQWKLSKEQTEPNSFMFKSNNQATSITIKKNKINLSQNKKEIGNLNIDMENVYVEKLHGKLFDKQFILDPVWIKKKTKVDAVKILIDKYKTEIVHKPKHKETLWTGAGKASRMLISKNKSLCLNKKLIMNIKKIHWQSFTLHTIQWYTPWYRLPIQGNYKLLRD